MHALYFNLDLTLTRMDRDFGDIVVRTLREAGVSDDSLDAAELSDLFFSYFTRLEPDPRVRAFADYFERHGVDADPERAAARWGELELAAVEPVDERLPAVLETLGETFHVGVLTSGLTDLQHAKLEKLGVTAHLADVLVSYEVGETKESGGLFAAAESRVDAEAYAYVSTSESDIEAARTAGWTTVDREFPELADAPVETVQAAFRGR